MTRALSCVLTWCPEIFTSPVVAWRELKQQIISGKFENGDKFYTEAELIQLFNVSSITVVRALNELANDGYIIRQQGKGTFVSRARKHKLVEFSDVETFPIQKDKVTVLSIKRGNNLKILEKLELAPTQFYYKIDRIRNTEGKTYIYHQTYIPDRSPHCPARRTRQNHRAKRSSDKMGSSTKIRENDSILGK